MIFDNTSINAKTLTASGTLPFLWEPVKHKGRELVDGMFGANPPISPLLDVDADDIYVLNLGSTENNAILKDRLEYIDATVKHRRKQGLKTPRIHVVHMNIPGTIISKLNSNDVYMDDLRAHGRKIARTFITAQQHGKNKKRNATPLVA